MSRFRSSHVGRVQLLAIFLFAGTIHAQSGPERSFPVPLTITSETMTVKNKENIAIFDSNVVIKKGDLTITADHVEILLEPAQPSDTKGDGSGIILPGSPLDNEAISQLRAWGNVKLREGSRRAEAREAIYDQKEEKIILLGEPVLFEKGYRVTGTRMTFYLKDNRSIVENSKVLLNPPSSPPPLRGEGGG